MKKFLWQNSLSIVLFTLFFVFLAALSVTGYLNENEERAVHGQQAATYLSYVTSGGFIEAVFENWESEFLQMGALVVLTIWLVQKGSADSKKLSGKNEVDTQPRYSVVHARGWAGHRKAIGEMLYANSLSLALFGLFAVSFILHALGGVAAANEEAQLHHQAGQSLIQYMSGPQFWYESFQNWQSEFLAVAMLLVLSIFLRQRGSPESKAIGESNSQTGS